MCFLGARRGDAVLSAETRPRRASRKSSAGWESLPRTRNRFLKFCAGPAGVKKFSQINVIPMLGMIYISYDYDDMMGLGTWGAFLVCYLYFGFIEKSKKK